MNLKDYYKQRLVEEMGKDINDPKDPKNLGLNIEKITAENPGSFVSHGDIFDQSDVIHLHKNLLDMAIKAGDKTAIERHTRILQKAGYKGNQK
jgi:hypothetical protein